VEAIELVRWGFEIWRPTSDWRKLTVYAMFVFMPHICLDFSVHTHIDYPWHKTLVDILNNYCWATFGLGRFGLGLFYSRTN